MTSDVRCTVDKQELRNGSVYATQCIGGCAVRVCMERRQCLYLSSNCDVAIQYSLPH